MLCFVVANSGREIQIDYDELGMAVLIDALRKARAGDGEVHLRTPANGGRELDEKSPWGPEGIGEVVIAWVGD